MRRSLWPTALGLAVIVLGAGCASATHEVAAAAAPSSPPALETSLATADATWAVVVMGGSAAEHDNFWQLFVRATGQPRWKLATPPGVADNGGLVLAGLGRSLVTGFLPSQGLRFSPLATTSNDGRSWQASKAFDAGLADVADPLAAAPGTGRLLALSSAGTAELSATRGSGWAKLADTRTLAASQPGRRCRISRLTAVSFAPSGTPLLGGACQRPGTVGIFAATGRTWHAAGPALAPSLAGHAVAVLRLTGSGTANLALLATATATVLVARTRDGGAHWALSPPLSLGGAHVRSAGFGTDGSAWLILSDGRAETLRGPGAVWRALAPLPPRTAVLAAGPAGEFDALASRGATLTAWRLGPRATAWRPAQTINVPIQYGSSG